MSSESGRGVKGNGPIPPSCFRCRRRKIKCDKTSPCAQCLRAHAECTFPGQSKRRPVSRDYVEALENQISSLEIFIQKLYDATPELRQTMLENFKNTASDHLQAPPTDRRALLESQPRNGHLFKTNNKHAAQLYGETSYLPKYSLPPPDGDNTDKNDDEATSYPLVRTPALSNKTAYTKGLEMVDLDHSNSLIDSPRSVLCQRLMTHFFRNHYFTSNMYIYREYFLRDFQEGAGPHYSDLLMYAICAVSATANSDADVNKQAELFAAQADYLLHESGFEFPDLTALQSLLLLSQYHIGRGRNSKGWLYSGIAFRLAHEMGLHVDPHNWSSKIEAKDEQDVLRRVYWGAFIADKQISLYFGRPPALYPDESDVTATSRIPFPLNWSSLKKSYIEQSSDETHQEDGPTIITTFVQQVELCRISHFMIADVFERRSSQVDEPSRQASIDKVDVALNKWLDDLPTALHWNQWHRGQLPAYVINLHIFYHTLKIVLHRPPSKTSVENIAFFHEHLKVCFDSLDAITALLKAFSKQDDYKTLPLSIVHTLSCAASIVVLNRQMHASDQLKRDTSSQCDILLNAIDGISPIWAPMKQLKALLIQGCSTSLKSSVGLGNIPDEMEEQSSSPIFGSFGLETEQMGLWPGIFNNEMEPFVFLQDFDDIQETNEY